MPIANPLPIGRVETDKGFGIPTDPPLGPRAEYLKTLISGHLGPAPSFAADAPLICRIQPVMTSFQRIWTPVLFLIVAAIPQVSWAQAGQGDSAKTSGQRHLSTSPEFDTGFHLLYELKFGPAREEFTAWERQNPDEPLGPALEAAADLFEEFYRKGVLTSDFFLDDRRLLGGIVGKPDADLEASFNAAAQRSEELARKRLASDPNNPDALFAQTLSAGMQADNASLLEKRQIESLGFLREADRSAKALLAVAPDAGDAYLAIGAANYIIGCLPAYKRAFLRMGGVHGDRAAGMQQLAQAASGGHYLRAYAKLMLALAELREKKPTMAREQLAELAAEFPGNPLFAHELLKLSASTAQPHPSDD